MARSRGARGAIWLLAVLVGLAAAGLVLVYTGGADTVRRAAYPLRYDDYIAHEASANHVDPYLVAAVIRAESGFDPNAVSGAGAVGLMQVKPSTARNISRLQGIEGKMNKAALVDPETNIEVGTAYLGYLLERYDGDEQLALAAYNAGLTNADRWSQHARETGRLFVDVIEYPETADYVAKVAMQRNIFRWLYPEVFKASGR